MQNDAIFVRCIYGSIWWRFELIILTHNSSCLLMKMLQITVIRNNVAVISSASPPEYDGSDSGRRSIDDCRVEGVLFYAMHALNQIVHTMNFELTTLPCLINSVSRRSDWCYGMLTIRKPSLREPEMKRNQNRRAKKKYIHFDSRKHYFQKYVWRTNKQVHSIEAAWCGSILWPSKRKSEHAPLRPDKHVQTDTLHAIM